MATANKMYDVLIIGGGPAGLSTALGLARRARSALVLDSQQYPDENSDGLVDVLIWDHQSLSSFRDAARENITSRYDNIDFQLAKIQNVQKKEDGTFVAVDEDQNKYQGKKLVLAIGVTYVLPDIKGFKELWGKSIFNSQYCNGFELRGTSSVGILAYGTLAHPIYAFRAAKFLTPLVKEVTLYCFNEYNDELRAEVEKEAGRHALALEPRRITALERKGKHITIHFEDGDSREEDYLTCIPPYMNNASPFHKQLGLQMDPKGFIKTGPTHNNTSEPGVYAVGDCCTSLCTSSFSITQATATGSLAAARLFAELMKM